MKKENDEYIERMQEHAMLQNFDILKNSIRDLKAILKKIGNCEDLTDICNCEELIMSANLLQKKMLLIEFNIKNFWIVEENLFAIYKEIEKLGKDIGAAEVSSYYNNNEKFKLWMKASGILRNIESCIGYFALEFAEILEGDS